MEEDCQACFRMEAGAAAGLESLEVAGDQDTLEAGVAVAAAEVGAVQDKVEGIAAVHPAGRTDSADYPEIEIDLDRYYVCPAGQMNFHAHVVACCGCHDTLAYCLDHAGSRCHRDPSDCCVFDHLDVDDYYSHNAARGMWSDKSSRKWLGKPNRPKRRVGRMKQKEPSISIATTKMICT